MTMLKNMYNVKSVKKKLTDLILNRCDVEYKFKVISLYVYEIKVAVKKLLRSLLAVTITNEKNTLFLKSYMDSIVVFIFYHIPDR